MAKKPTSKVASALSPNFSSAPELICIAAPSAGLRSNAATGIASVSGASTKSLNAMLNAVGATMVPIFGSEPRVAASRAAVAAAEAASLPALTGYYSVRVAPDKMAKLATALMNDPNVLAAYVKPAAVPAIWLDDKQGVDAAPDGEQAPTASFIARQLYLEVAPGGIDARYAWTRGGGKGLGVRVIDIEGAWRFGHEDLLQNQGGVIGGTESTALNWRNHGTAVVGVIGADENAFGVTGIAPLANTRAISIFGTTGSANAIRQAADALSAGDIILIELHRQGPDGNGTGQDGFIAIEWWPDDFAAVLYAASRGVIVVEAAGNGARNLDAAVFNTRPAGFPASWSNPFNLANPQSGAIVVGAGAPPPGTHGSDHGPDRSRLDFSNHGARVDTQGWGQEVTTTGYGNLQGGTNEDLWYTDTFNGTSSASPIIVGAVACMQGALRAASRPLLTPATARDILRTTGSAQTDAPGRPATQRIGNRPNLRQAINRLIPLKTLKQEKIEIKELKEGKFEKIERKELKDKDKDKEIKIEKNEKIERKELKERKLEKIESKEFEQKNLKENIKEAGEKGLFEKQNDKLNEKIGEKGFEVQRPSMDDDFLAERLAQLEQTVAALSHFIPAELRPELGASALNHEQDLQALQQEMQANVDEAKALKDVRDVC
jgi:Subtilase family